MKHRKTYLDDLREQGNPYFEHECPKCGWNALIDYFSEDGLEQGCCEVISSRETHTDFGPGFDIHIKCTCPICNEEFEYFDGSP